MAKVKGPWNKENITALLEKSDNAVRRGVVVIYDRQTSDEKDQERTKHFNARGFNGMDAEFGTSIAKQILAGRNLSPKQISAARKFLRKYAGQLALVANDRAGSEVIPAVTEMNPGMALYNPALVEKTYEASELNDRCPNCNGTLQLVNGHKDNEGDYTYWDVKCPCGSTFTVFND